MSGGEPFVVIGEGDESHVVVEGGEVVEVGTDGSAAALLAIAELRSKFEMPRAWIRDANFRASLPIVAFKNAPVLVDIHVDGQSLSNGTLSENRLRDFQPRPDNAFMKELAGGADKQGPWKASHEFTGSLIPLIEGLTTRNNPSVTNPVTGLVNPFGMGNGETICSGLVDQLLDQVEASGLSLEMVRICITSVGIGGRQYKELTVGTLSDKWLRESVATGFKYARSQGWGYHPVKVWVHGETDSNQNPVAGDEEPVLSSDMTHREYAAYLLQDRARFRELVREATGIDYDPYYFTSQCGSTYPGGWRKKDMRLANTAEGQRLATHMDPRIVGGPTNYVATLVDRLHCFMAGYNLLGRGFGDPIFRTIFGNGRYRPPEMVATRRTSQTRARIVVDNSAGELRVQRYSVSEWLIAAGGTKYRAGDEIRTTTMDTAARWVVDAVDSIGMITDCHLTDPGSHRFPVDGLLQTQAQISGATVANPGFGAAIDGAYATVQGGSFTKQARFTVIAPAASVTGFLLFDAGEYSALPANPVVMSTTGVTGLTANINSLGSGATINALSYKQLCHTNDIPFFQNAVSSGAPKTIQNVGSGYLRGDVAYAIGGVVSSLPGAHPASINVGLIDTDGGITSAGMRSGGVYKILPPQPVEYRSATGSGCTINSPESCFPVAEPGNCGVDVDDDTPVLAGVETLSGLRPPRVIDIKVVDDADVARTAIDVTVDQPWGGATFIMAGQHPQGANGPTAGGRTLLASAPPKGSRPGPLGLFPQAYLWRGGIKLDSPDYQSNNSNLDNTRFMVAQEGAPTAFVIPANNGVYPLDRWRAYRGVMGGRFSRVAGDRQTYALRLQRLQGDNATGQIQVTHAIVGEQVNNLIGKTLVAGVRGRFGGDARGSAALRVYTFPAVANFGGSLPPSSSTLMVRTILADQAGWDARYVGSGGQLPSADVLVPVGTQMIVFSVIYTPESGVAGTEDYFEFEEPSLNTGTLLRSFNPSSDAEEWDRCARWYRRMSVYVGTTPTVVALNPPMRTAPVVTGGGPGFSSVNTTADALVVSQTTAGVQQLVLNARL